MLAFIVLIILILIARKTVQKMVENSRENKFDKNDGVISKSGIDVNYFVQSYHQALNPSGYSWMESWDGTDEDAIFNLAKNSKGHLTEISRAYKAKYQQSLLDALSSELSTEDLAKWRTLAE